MVEKETSGVAVDGLAEVRAVETSYDPLGRESKVRRSRQAGDHKSSTGGRPQLQQQQQMSHVLCTKMRGITEQVYTTHTRGLEEKLSIDPNQLGQRSRSFPSTRYAGKSSFACSEMRTA